jgi:fibronectin-binding autotransporter adhesin
MFRVIAAAAALDPFSQTFETDVKVQEISAKVQCFSASHVPDWPMYFPNKPCLQAAKIQPSPTTMKPRNIHLILTSTLLLAPAAHALDGTWINTAGGLWGADTNWAGGPPGIIAEGSGFTAGFNTLNIAADTTVSLDTDRTIGNLVFGDTTTSTAGSWILAGAGDPVGKLTLAGASPTITVSALGINRNATITATLEGTVGFTKDGAGALVLNNNTNTISGPVVISAGTLSIQSKPLTNASSVAINAGTLVVATVTGNAIGADNNAKISFGGGTLQYNVDTPGTDYSARFSTDPNQQYRINVISVSSTPKVVTLSSNLASAGGTLTKLSTGTLILAASNTFTGATTVSAGTLELSNAQALQNSAINTTASAAGTTTAGLVLTGVTSPTFGGLTGTKALASLFDSDTGNYNLVTNVTLNPGTGASYSYAAAIADGASGMTLTKSGDGTQILTVANTYTGSTILSGGILNYGNASALSSGPVSFTGNSTLQAGVATTLVNAISVATGITGTFDNNSFATTLGGALTGAGAFTKTGSGVLTLTGGLNNNLAGGVNVNAGRLNVTDGLSLTNTAGTITVASGAAFNFSKNFEFGNDLANALNLSGPGASGFGALNLQGNATATGPITLAADTTISHNFNNATISGSITGSNRNLTLTTTQAGQPGTVISGPIQLGTGGITVTGVANTNGLEDYSVKLSGNNSYSGETRVLTGKLWLTGSSRIPNASTVRIDSGAVLHLDFPGTDTVAALYLPGDPNPKPAGTYGSLTSAATNKSTDFAGDGILQVGGGGGDYTTWAGTNGIPGEPFDGDFNKDGISNGAAYALGLSPTASSQPAGILTGSTITFTKGADAISNGDVTWIIETSLTLSGSWSEEVVQAPGNAAATISYNLDPLPGTPKKFARLKVVSVP